MTAAEVHTGQHLQGCVSCYAHADRPDLPVVGTRVAIDVTIMGETFPVIAIVIGHEGDAIRARPEGAVATFTRSEWRVLWATTAILA